MTFTILKIEHKLNILWQKKIISSRILWQLLLVIITAMKGSNFSVINSSVTLCSGYTELNSTDYSYLLVFILFRWNKQWDGGRLKCSFLFLKRVESLSRPEIKYFKLIACYTDKNRKFIWIYLPLFRWIWFRQKFEFWKWNTDIDLLLKILFSAGMLSSRVAFLYRELERQSV